jgi:hypothetical protein
MTDRNGKVYPNGISPDEYVATDWTRYGTADDPALASALAWLRDQPACRAA